MIVKDLRNSFYPCPKERQGKMTSQRRSGNTVERKEQNIKSKIVTDFCIMPKSTKYSTKRTRKYNERHEVFFSRAFRNKSIKDGLIVFLTEETHRGTNGVHGKNGNKFNIYLKKAAQKAWMNYYKKTKQEFIERYGQNYI